MQWYVYSFDSWVKTTQCSEWYEWYIRTWNLPRSQMLMMSLCIRAVLPPFSWSRGRNWAGNWWLILAPYIIPYIIQPQISSPQSQLLTVSRSARCCGPLGTACMALRKMWLQIPTVQYNGMEHPQFDDVFPCISYGKRMQKGVPGVCLSETLLAHLSMMIQWFKGFGSARFSCISSYHLIAFVWKLAWSRKTHKHKQTKDHVTSH